MAEKMKRPSVSVIIPIYNIGDNIINVQKSIINQELKDAEYIFVDDHSTDGFQTCFCKWIVDMKNEGLNVQLISHEINKGVAAARNTGLDNAIGEYIYFLDADDYLESQALREMYDRAVESQADIVGIEWNLTYGKNERRMNQAHATNGKELFENLCFGVSRWNLWLFMVKRDFFDDLRFTPGDNMGEDMMAMLTISSHADKVEMIHKQFYHYVQTNPNAITQNWSDEYRRQVTSNLDRAIAQIGTSENYDQLQCMKLTLKLPLLISSKKTDFEKWHQWWSEANLYIKFNPKQSWRTKLLQDLAIKHRYWLLKIYYKIVIKLIYGVIYR